MGVRTIAPRDAAAIIAWSCVQIFLGAQAFLVSGIYRSARRNPRGGLLGTGGAAARLLIGIAVLFAGGSPLAYVIAVTWAWAACLAVLFYDAHRIMPQFTLTFRGISIRGIRPYIVPGLGQAGLPLVQALQNQGTLLVLGALLGPVAVAIFQTTRVLTNGVKSMIGLFSGAIMVEIPALLGEGRKETIQRLLILNTQAALLAVAGGLAFLGLFGTSVYRLWLGRGQVYPATLVLLLCMSLMPFALGNSFIILLYATNEIHRAIGLIIAAAVGSLALTAAGAHRFGIPGAGAGAIVYEFATFVAVAWAASECGVLNVAAVVRGTCDRQAIRHVLKSSTGLALSIIRRD